jgi:long-chain acyl-CoA synthetase
MPMFPANPTPDPTTPHRPATGLGARLLERTALRGDEPAILHHAGASPVSFDEFGRRVRDAAGALVASGLGPGDRFAVLSHNSDTMLELAFAASCSGAVMVPLNTRLSPREIGFIVDDADPRLILVEDDLLPLLEQTTSQPPSIRIHSDGRRSDEYLAWHDAGHGAHASGHVPASSSVVLQMYTTGTTGLPKGVMLNEANLRAMTDKVPEIFMLSEASTYLALLPMFHISGGGTPIAALVSGASVAMSSRIAATEVPDDLQLHQVTHANLVPSLISLLVADPATVRADLSSLEVVMYGAAPSNGAVIADAMALLPSCWFLHGYGLTECTGGVAYAVPHRHGEVDAHPGTVGRAAPGCELRTVDPETLLDVQPGEAGEVWVRSPQNTAGYWNRTDETAALYAEPGWLRTGDIGVIDHHGMLALKDRLKDMIISGGENVYSAEVEHVLGSHPTVLEVAVFGVPDERWGEAVKAAVILRPGRQATPIDLIEHCREHLAHYKCPKHIEFVDEFPRSASGKILKRVLRHGSE